MKTSAPYILYIIASLHQLRWKSKPLPKPMRVLLRPEAAAAAVVQRAVLQRKGEESALFPLNSVFHTLEVHLPVCAEPSHAVIKKNHR